MNLLEIGKILRPHGIKGGVKVESYMPEGLKQFKHIYVSNKKIESRVTSVQSLTGDFFVLYIDAILDVDSAEKFRNQPIYINREEYVNYKDELYLSDLINKDVVDETNEKIGVMVDFDDYGASSVLTIRVGAVSYQIPYVNDIIYFDKSKDAFVISKQTFEDMKV